MANVLLIDDDREIRFGLNRVLARCGYSVIEATSGEYALEQIKNHTFDLVFCDLKFPTGISGEETLKAIIQSHPEMKVVMMSCAMDYDIRDHLKSHGAAECVQKPIFKTQCLDIVNALIPTDKEAA